MSKPKFCESGLYNFDIKSYFQENELNISLQNYYDAKFKYLHLLFKKSTNKKKAMELISHDIWLTNPENPRQITAENIALLKNKLLIMDEENSNWHHILWVNCELEINKTKNMLKNSNIEFRNINKPASLSTISGDLSNLIKAELYGIAKDILQWFILEKYGGFFSDINFVLFESPESLMKTYDFFIQTLPLYGFILTPSMLFARKSHPILLGTLEKLMANKDKLLELYELYPDCDLYNLTLIITYFPFLASFYQYSNKNNTIDIAIDPQIYDVHKNIKGKNFSPSLVQKILSDYNFDNLTCDVSKESKSYEEYVSQYEDYGICILGSTIGVDLEESSWIL